MTITAVILSASPVSMSLPAGVVALNHNEKFTTTKEIHMARRRAVAKVRTNHFFFLDSDDRLPDDAESVLAECLAANTALAYTDELIIPDEGSEEPTVVTRRGPYDQAKHAQMPLFVHHLALLQTEAARDALQVVPTGDYWLEQLLYFQAAKAGVAYVPRTGYHWHRGDSGMHTAKGIIRAQLQSAAWCIRNPD